MVVLCRVLGVSRSGFHDHLARQANPSPDRDATVRCDLKRVARRLREEGVCGKAKGRAKARTTNSGHARPVAENLLARQFDVTSPKPAWVSDITYIATREGWLYLAVLLSIQTRQVSCYSLSDRMPDDLGRAGVLECVAPFARSARRDVPLRPGEPVRQPSLPSHSRTAGLRAEYEPQAHLLGQCRDRVLLGRLSPGNYARTLMTA